MKNIVLVWVSPKANPETKIRVQVVYLGDDPRKHGERVESETRKRGGPMKVGNCNGQWAQSRCTPIEELTVWNTPQNCPSQSCYFSHRGSQENVSDRPATQETNWLRA